MRTLYQITSSGTTLTNSTSETVLASHSLGANALQAGKTYQLRAAVSVPSTNSTDTLTLKVRIGGTTLTGTAVYTSAAVDVANSDLAVIDCEIHVFSVGSSGAARALTQASTGPDASAIAVGSYYAAVSSLDTTAAILIELTGTWSVAHADNQCAAVMFAVREV